MYLFRGAGHGWINVLLGLLVFPKRSSVKLTSLASLYELIKHLYSVIGLGGFYEYVVPEIGGKRVYADPFLRKYG